MTVNESQETVTIWARNLTFAHFVRNTNGDVKSKEEGDKKDFMKTVAEAESRDDVFSVLLGMCTPNPSL